MTNRFATPPATGTPMAASQPSEDSLALLALRRSAGKLTLSAPGPDSSDVNELLTIAMRVPDHRRVEPWRFIVFEGDQRERFGAELASIYRTQNPDAADEEVERQAAHLPLRAPTVVAVVSSPDPTHKTPVWEQELSAGAVCQTLLLAANAAGWAGVWLTEWIAYDEAVRASLRLEANEHIAGFLYLGTATADPPERPRPDPAAKITRWSAG